MAKGMTYKKSGVDYDAMDPFKRMCQLAGRETSKNLKYLDLAEVEMSRGESVFLVEASDFYLAHVEEGLGTKNLVADEMGRLTGRTFYDQIAQCAVAMIVNDLITLGALPISTAMHLAVASGDWFNHKKRYEDLISGWKRACDLAHCVWGGGETPTLKDIIVPGTAMISGSASGIIKPKDILFDPKNIRGGDRIVFLTSSGIHANGLTMARKLAEKLPQGYMTKLPDGRTYGETLLDPTYIYVSSIYQCLYYGDCIHYSVNITGHGWRKLMRAVKPFSYIIEKLPPQLPIFDFIQKHGRVSDEEAYGNFNMGAGFALYVDERSAEEIVDRNAIGPPGSFNAIDVGHIEETGRKEVVIKPKGLTFRAETLAVR